MVAWIPRCARTDHAGLILKSPDVDRVETLVNQYSRRFSQEFVAHHPMSAHPGIA